MWGVMRTDCESVYSWPSRVDMIVVFAHELPLVSTSGGP